MSRFGYVYKYISNVAQFSRLNIEKKRSVFYEYLLENIYINQITYTLCHIKHFIVWPFYK